MKLESEMTEQEKEAAAEIGGVYYEDFRDRLSAFSETLFQGPKQDPKLPDDDLVMRVAAFQTAAMAVLVEFSMRFGGDSDDLIEMLEEYVAEVKTAVKVAMSRVPS